MKAGRGGHKSGLHLVVELAYVGPVTKGATPPSLRTRNSYVKELLFN